MCHSFILVLLTDPNFYLGIYAFPSLNPSGLSEVSSYSGSRACGPAVANEYLTHPGYSVCFWDEYT